MIISKKVIHEGRDEMKKLAIIYLLCLLILAGCGPNEAEIAQMLAQTVDALPTQTSQPTYTPPAVPTPQTVVITPTPASTPMRYDPTDCKAISIPDYSISPDRVWVQREHLKRYEGMCVEMYLQSRDAPNGEPQLFGILDNYVDSFGVELVFSTHTAGMIEIPSAFSRINGILLVPEDPDETVQLVMGEIIEIPANQQPLVGEGVVHHGVDVEFHGELIDAQLHRHAAAAAGEGERDGGQGEQPACGDGSSVVRWHHGTSRMICGAPVAAVVKN